VPSSGRLIVFIEACMNEPQVPTLPLERIILMRVFLLFLLSLSVMLLFSCQATSPGDVESRMAAEAKKMKIGGKDWQNPTPDTPAVGKTGMEHFQHHCQVCHGLDGHGTGVPFAGKMSPPVIVCLAKTSYTLRMYDLVHSSIRIVPGRFLP
jgi:hypothetical protein